MRKLKLLVIFILITVIIPGITSCNSYSEDSVSIVTTLFPYYDFTRQIVKDKANVQLILPPGMEPHTYEPTVRDIIEINNSDIFIYTGDFMEPWASKIINTLDNTYVVNSSRNIPLLTHDEEDEDHEGHHHESEYDPHIWLSPKNAMIIIDNILSALNIVDSDNIDFYEENASLLKQELLKLDEEIRNTLNKTTYKTIFYGGHFIFGYFAHEYDLEFISPYKGFTSEIEPTPQRVINLINEIKGSGIKYIFVEELVDPKVARVVVQETGIEMLPLNGIHSVKDLNNGVTYISLMKRNLENLKIGLEYHE